MQRLTPREIRRRRRVLREELAAGGTVVSAAARLGISRNTLTQFIGKHAWDLRPGRSRVPPDHPLYGVDRQGLRRRTRPAKEDRHGNGMEGPVDRG